MFSDDIICVQCDVMTYDDIILCVVMYFSVTTSFCVQCDVMLNDDFRLCAVLFNSYWWHHFVCMADL